MNYFENIEKQRLLKKALEDWIGTPFRHHCGVKGLGCDCIHFVARVFEEVGFLTWHKNLIPNYPKDWHIHNTRELLAEKILENSNIEEIGLSKVKNGDIVLSHYGKAASHVGIYFDGYVYQALNKIGVRKISFADKSFRRRMKLAYRLLE